MSSDLLCIMPGWSSKTTRENKIIGNYSVKNSPGDGHFLMHSLKSSLKFQLDIEVSIDRLSNMTINETLLNRPDYLPSTRDDNVNNLMNELFDYINRKRY